MWDLLGAAQVAWRHVATLTADFNEDGVPDVATAGGIGTSTQNMMSIHLGENQKQEPTSPPW
jgi:hypothetical protein